MQCLQAMLIAVMQHPSRSYALIVILHCGWTITIILQTVKVLPHCEKLAEALRQCDAVDMLAVSNCVKIKNLLQNAEFDLLRN